MTMLVQGEPRVNLYREVAGRINRLIDQGTFAAGDRLPSVRKLSVQLKVSISTVMEAYRVLEDRGLIEARPQSGYYVRHQLIQAPQVIQTSEPSPAPTLVSISDLASHLMRDSLRPDLLQLGAAIPNPAYLPVEKLHRTMAAVLRRNPNAGIMYDDLQGCEVLRIQLARRALAAGCTLTPDQIVTTTGSQDALNLCLRAVCKPGDTVAIDSPTYHGILQTIEMLGLKALEIPTHPRDGISIEALRYALDQTTVNACMIISNFHNPLGSSMPDARKRELVELLAEREIPLIEDDIYGDLPFAESRPGVCKSYDRDGLVMMCSSFSKTLAPGYRVGWVAAGRFQSKIEHLKLVTTLCSPSPTQLGLAEFLENGGYDHHLRSIRRLYQKQMHAMSQAVATHFPEGTRMTQPQGGTVLWVEMPQTVDSLVLYNQALEAGMTIAPGPMFSAKGKYRNFIRLNIAFWSDPVERAIARLGGLAARLV